MAVDRSADDTADQRRQDEQAADLGSLASGPAGQLACDEATDDRRSTGLAIAVAVTIVGWRRAARLQA